MTRARLLSTAMLGVLCLATLAPAADSKVAVVDMQGVFEQLKEKTAVEAQLQSKAQALGEEAKTKEQELKNLQNDLEILARNSTAFNQKLEQLEQRAFELKNWRDYQTNKINRDRAMQMEDLYRKALEAVGQVATENGFNIVLFKEPELNLTGAKPEQIAAIIQSRKVLWADDDHDITSAVITHMNNKFQNLP